MEFGFSTSLRRIRGWTGKSRPKVKRAKHRITIAYGTTTIRQYDAAAFERGKVSRSVLNQPVKDAFSDANPTGMSPRLKLTTDDNSGHSNSAFMVYSLPGYPADLRSDALCTVCHACHLTRVSSRAPSSKHFPRIVKACSLPRFLQFHSLGCLLCSKVSLSECAIL